MLNAAFVILSATVLLGAALAILRLRSEGVAVPPWPLAGLHGILAIGGFGCLMLGLRGPPRGLDIGAGSFGLIAAWLIGLAALVGGGMLTTHLLKRRITGMLIGIHATFAVSGLVILATHIFLG